MFKLNNCMSRRTFVKQSVHLLVSIGAVTTVQAIRPAVPSVLAQTPAPAKAYGTGAYGQGAYAGSPVTNAGRAQQGHPSKTVISVYLPLVNK